MKQKIKYLSLLCSITLSADQFSFLFYNDLFSGTDKHFTNGMSLSWIDDSFEDVADIGSNSYSSYVHNIVNSIPFNVTDSSKKHSAGISLSQIMVTPKDLTLSQPQYNDIPYAGYLALAFYMFEWDKESFKEFRMEFGVVGKASGAEFVQKSIHTVIGAHAPQGWDNQLGTQVTANALFRYGEISWQRSGLNTLSMDWFNHFGVQVGNFQTNAFGGTMFRVGKNYIKNFNLHYPYLKEEASMLCLDDRHNGFGWSLSAGVNGEILAYSYILDEGKNEGYATDKHIINATLYSGLDLYYGVHKLTYFYQSRSPYTKESNSMESFGGLIYSYQF